jgi:hypothetical protein
VNKRILSILKEKKREDEVFEIKRLIIEKYG